MPENRYFIDLPLREKRTVRLSGEEALHLIRVMRKKVGDEVELVNGKHQLAYATISACEKNEAELYLNQVKTITPANKKLILAQGLTKPSNLDLIIEKGTELGASEFWLFPGDKSEKKALSKLQYNRLIKISIAALKQCGRLDLPEIREKKPLEEWPILPNAEVFFGDLSESAAPFPKTIHAEIIVIFIGPEMGFSFKEQEILVKRMNAKGIRLNSNILRAETAAICSIGLFWVVLNM